MTIYLQLLFLALAVLVLPSEAITRIAADEDCYEPGETIHAAFQTDNPTVHDWIALVPADTALDPFAAHLTVDWMRTCGRKNCNQIVARSSGDVTLPTTLVSQGTWKVVLVTLGTGVWVGVAESQTFEMRSAGACSSGGGNRPPTRAPTRRPTLAPTRTDSAALTATPTNPQNQGSSSVSTNKRTYAANEKILVTFQNANPRSSDWVGIYSASTPSNNLLTGEFWMWVCGGQSQCASTVS